LLELLNSHEVEYVIVGAHALAFHGAPRYTGDIDIFVHRDRSNADRLMAALRDFGFGSVGLTANDFMVDGLYGNVPVNYIGREQFIANKRACGRMKDLSDIEALGD
jgi:hypothetical protein